MANYYPHFRSSYFKVKDLDEFKKFCSDYELELVTDNHPDYGTLYGFLQGHMNEMGIPDWRYDKELDEEIDVDFPEELSKHLAEGWAAEVREIGYEGMRYLFGFSFIVNWKGEDVSLSLDEIVDKARSSWGDGFHITSCEY